MRYGKGKSGKKGVLVLTVSAVFLILFLLNLCVTALAREYPFLSFDLTKTRLFALSPQTVENIRALRKPVTIFVLARENDFAKVSSYNAQANEVIRQYEKNSGGISLVYVDYVKDPTFAASYPGVIMKHGDILVSCENNYTLVKTEELFNYAAGAGGNLSILSSRAEEAVYTAILKVSSEKPVEATVIAGHGEYTMDGFLELLRKNNYRISAQNLVTGDIDPAADIVLIIAPKSDFSEGELEKLDRYLANGGGYGKTILYCADADQPRLEALSVFLREWGVLAGDGAVFETDEKRVYNYHPFYAVADYAEDSYSGLLRGMAKPVLMPVSRPLETLFEYRNNYSAKVLLSFAASTGVRPSGAPPDFTADDAVRRGPIPALVLCAYSLTDRQSGKATAASYLLVSGSAGMLDGYSVNNPSFGNGEYLVNLLNSLTNRADIIAFQPKSFAGSPLNLPRAQVNILGLACIAAVPLSLLAAGLAVWTRRRRA
ncbi:MAG: Gldg family protein [Spirochaetaceae bacterium]|jgi:hypothetical protein|nr:Gldg family protein [Spirochaetaceae bacterium]